MERDRQRKTKTDRDGKTSPDSKCLPTSGIPTPAPIESPKQTNKKSRSVGVSIDTLLTPLPVVGLYFPLVISSFSSLVKCVAFRSFSLCLLLLSQQARPRFILVSQFVLVYFIIRSDEQGLFVLVQ